VEYYLCRFRNMLWLVKWITTLILFVRDRYGRVFFILLFLLNLGIFFYIENWHGELISPGRIAWWKDLGRVGMGKRIRFSIYSPLMIFKASLSDQSQIASASDRSILAFRWINR
jgi:hypothetical protein